MSCPTRKQPISLAQSRKNEWRILEQEREQRRKEEKTAEKAKEAEEAVEVAATVEMERTSEEEHPVTNDGEDRGVRM